MSQAATLLSSLYSEATSNTDDGVLVINHYTRAIDIPDSITTLGVESDDDVLRLNFRMPRYLGKVDLSTFSIRINYINARGEDDVYKVTDSAIVGDNVTFSWLVGPTATAYKGNTRFNVCMVITDSESVIQQEYNTTIATLPVLEGLECDERIVSEYTDLLEQWENRLFGIGDTEEASLLATSEAQQQAIIDKGAEVLETIPEDYTTTYNLAYNASKTKADAIICSYEGEVISVSDSSDDFVRNLQIFGKTTQVTTTGKNLCSLGTVSFTTFTQLENEIVIPAGIYTFSAVIQSSDTDMEHCLVRFYDEAQTEYTNVASERSSGTTRVSFTFTVDTDRKYIYLYASTSYANGEGDTATFTDIQIESGETATDYEIYSGGVASPSPAWAQDLASVENPTVTIAGKNLLDFVGVIGDGYTNTLNGLTVVVEDGFATTTGTNTSSDFTNILHPDSIPSDKRVTLPAGTYSTHPSLRISVAGTITPSRWANLCGTFTFDEPFLITSFYIAYRANETVNETVPLTLVAGSVIPTAYEEWHPIQTITPAYTLPGIPVAENGNYTDENGQAWICDEIDFERGVYVQRCFSETLAFEYQDNLDRYSATLTHTANVNCAEGNGIPVLCLTFPFDPLAGTGTPKVNGIRIATTSPKYAIAYYNGEIIEAATVLYPLATPIETSLTTEEIEAFKALYTNFSNTTVLNDAGAWMKLKYNADTKTYLDNLPKATDEQVWAAVDAWLTAKYGAIAEEASF